MINRQPLVSILVPAIILTPYTKRREAKCLTDIGTEGNCDNANWGVS